MAVRFGTVTKVSHGSRVSKEPDIVTSRLQAASHIRELVRPLTQLFEIDCQEVWRELVNYTEGDLTPEMRNRIERHLQDCPHCRAVYDGSQNIVRLLGDKNILELPQGFSQRLYRHIPSKY